MPSHKVLTLLSIAKLHDCSGSPTKSSRRRKRSSKEKKDKKRTTAAKKKQQQTDSSREAVGGATSPSSTFRKHTSDSSANSSPGKQRRQSAQIMEFTLVSPRRIALAKKVEIDTQGPRQTKSLRSQTVVTANLHKQDDLFLPADVVESDFTHDPGETSDSPRSTLMTRGRAASSLTPLFPLPAAIIAMPPAPNRGHRAVHSVPDSPPLLPSPRRTCSKKLGSSPSASSRVRPPLLLTVDRSPRKANSCSTPPSSERETTEAFFCPLQTRKSTSSSSLDAAVSQERRAASTSNCLYHSFRSSFSPIRCRERLHHLKGSCFQRDGSSAPDLAPPPLLEESQCWSEEDKEAAIAAVYQTIRDLERRAKEMDKLIQHTLPFVQTRLESNNQIGAMLSMKQTLKYEQLKKKALEGLTRANQLAFEVECSDTPIHDFESRTEAILQEAYKSAVAASRQHPTSGVAGPNCSKSELEFRTAQRTSHTTRVSAAADLKQNIVSPCAA